MSLLNYLKTSKNSVARERLLYMRAASEMKLYAAGFNEQIQMTEPEIDNNGYDFTISLGHYHAYIQNKSTLSSSRVKQWAVHPVFLQASFYESDIAPMVDGLPVWGTGFGASGGVLLHVIDSHAAMNGELCVTYYYFDIFYAGAVSTGLHKPKGFSQEQALELLRKINDGKDGERVNIPYKAFLPIRSPSAIVGLRFNLPPFQQNFISSVHLSCEMIKNGESVDDIVPLWNKSISPWII